MHVSDTPQYRTVMYHKHGKLFKRWDNKEWTFQSEEFETGFVDMDLIFVLDQLSMDGYDLICRDDENNFILRTREEFEETEEWYEFDDEK